MQRVAEPVELVRDARRDDFALAQGRSGFRMQGFRDAFVQGAAVVQGLAFALEGGLGDGRVDGGGAAQRAGHLQGLARQQSPGRDLCHDALQVADAGEFVAHDVQQRRVRQEGVHDIIAFIEFLDVLQRHGEPFAQQARAHRRDALPHDVDQRTALGAGQRLEDFEVAHREAVHPDIVPLVQARNGPDVAQGAVLRHFQVIQHGPGGLDGQRHVIDAEPFERAGAELAAEFVAGRFRREHPRVERRDAGFLREALAEALHVGALQQDFAGREGAEQDVGIVQRPLRDLERAGRDVEKGQSRFLSAEIQRGEPVVLARAQQVVVVGQARRDEFRHAAAHELFGELRVFELVADRGLVARVHQLGQVVLQRVVGDAGHFDEAAVSGGLARKHDAQHAAGRERIFAVGLVEVADPVQQDGFGILGLDLEVLPEHRRGRSVFLFHREQKYRKNRR